MPGRHHLIGGCILCRSLRGPATVVAEDVLDPWLSLAALTLTLAGNQVLPDGDPGPHPSCPEDMRLVEGVHHETMGHVCLDKRDGQKDPQCYRYAEGMSLLEAPATEVRVCMDQYEAPNVRGKSPIVMQSFLAAEKWCGKRGKRVCTEQEWELACEG